MGALRSRKILRCFYCGRKSSLRFEGQKSFECSICDATNWLDENGEITDPPSTSPSIERDYVRYAVPRGSSVLRSPSPSLPPEASFSEDPVFCSTCLRNQHMLTSSLAQFEWPDNPTSAEYAARERKYWALRKDLENRYPQMCADCEPKVERKLHDASYTAQTDHLRRMMDRTRSRRREVKNRGVLDAVDILGKCSWHLGFTLQFLWHTVIILSLLAEYFATSDDASRLGSIIVSLYRVSVGRLPHPDRLMTWAINIGMCSFPWNPRFKQTIRGFTTHILGFRQWYSYQLVILLIRSVCLSMAQYNRSQRLPAMPQLGAQIMVVFLMIYVYRVAASSIHTDMTPLFRPPTKTTGAGKPRVKPIVERNPNDLGSVLDDIMHPPSSPPSQLGSQSFSESFSESFPRAIPAANESRNNSFGTNLKIHSPESSFGSLGPYVRQSDSQVTHYEEEMDWSPSASQHRAFSSYNPYKIKNTNPRFSDAPIEPKPGPIWYKVPPAPTNPAQRLRNPPMRPIIRENPREKKENFFQTNNRGPVDIGTSSQTSSSNINFAPPKFYAPEPKDDPRDSLSNMFASSFSISPDPDEEAVRHARPANKSAFDFRPNRNTSPTPNRSITRVGELIVLFGALGAWIFALDTREHYGPTLALASICACLIVSIRLAADLEVDAQIRGGQRPSVFAPSLVNLGLAQVIAALILMWNVWSGSTTWIEYGVYGNVLFGGMIIHQMWHTFV
ncbi:Ima1 N-terminal domain-containing protein [Biscogniauxia mediterranea]|nr:Ima1 N-terminal domain-containing protein [Biscogniauxia mediterranea]